MDPQLLAMLRYLVPQLQGGQGGQMYAGGSPNFDESAPYGGGANLGFSQPGGGQYGYGDGSANLGQRAPGGGGMMWAQGQPGMTGLQRPTPQMHPLHQILQGLQSKYPGQRSPGSPPIYGGGQAKYPVRPGATQLPPVPPGGQPMYGKPVQRPIGTALNRPRVGSGVPMRAM